MASIVQFVDSISASPTVRLDLNSLASGLMLDSDNAIDLSPPPLERAFASTMLVDGDRVVASSYGNRSIKIGLRAVGGVPESIQTVIQDLAQELDRTDNLLKVQLAGMSAPVFFHTFRAPDFVLSVVRGYLAIGAPLLQIEIPAYSFAYGLMATVTPVAVSNDPAAGSNGRFLDITGVLGDVETPLQLRVPGASVGGKQTLICTRRGGTPSNMPFLLQAESMTLGTDTATQVNNTTYSGAGANSTVTSFATVTSSAVRLQTTLFPATPSTDVRGTYNVYARCSGSASATSFGVQLEHGTRAIKNTEATFTQSSASPVYQPMLDLGQVQIPEGFDPIGNGPTNTLFSVNGIPLKVYLRRISATGSCVVDYLLFVPADDTTVLVNWGASTPTTFVLDGGQRSVYGLDASGRVADIASAYFAGDPPTVSPNVTNRIVIVNDVSPTNTVADVVSSTVTWSAFYWPQYLTIRPAST